MGLEDIKPIPERHQSKIALGLILGILGALLVGCYVVSSSGSTPPPAQACPSDVRTADGVGDAFSDGFQQGLTGCR